MSDYSYQHVKCCLDCHTYSWTTTITAYWITMSNHLKLGNAENVSPFLFWQTFETSVAGSLSIAAAILSHMGLLLGGDDEKALAKQSFTGLQKGKTICSCGLRAHSIMHGGWPVQMFSTYLITFDPDSQRSDPSVLSTCRTPVGCLVN